MKAALVLVAALALLVAAVHAAPVRGGAALRRPVTGGCPNPPVNTTVDLKAYLGFWYEIGDTKEFRDLFERGVVCMTANYTLESADPLTVSVVNEGRKGSPSGPLDPYYGKATVVAPGKLKVSFGGPFSAPYWITQLYGEAETGYDVAVVYSCENFGITNFESLFIISRTPKLPAPFTVDGLLAVSKSQGINVDKLGFEMTLQDGCW